MEDKLSQELKAAQLARDNLRTQTLKSLKAALQNQKIEAGGQLTAEDELRLVQREIKKRHEAAEMYSQAGRVEQAETENAEAVILGEFLPTQLTDDELLEIIQAAIDQAGASSIKDMGKVMSIVSPRVVGRASQAEVATTVKDLLNE